MGKIKATVETRPYVVCIVKDDTNIRFGMDRNYNYMPDADIAACEIGDIVQSEIMDHVPYLGRPDWADGHEDWVILWFNYYD